MLIQRTCIAAWVLAVAIVAMTEGTRVAVADPVWPSAGDQSAADTIEDLKAFSR